jgi:signal transduction histidine kinase
MPQLKGNVMSGLATGETKILVLHVDDDRFILAVSKQILEAGGKFQVETASSVEEAFQKLQAQPFDAIVSDYEMPQKNGLVFLEELRRQKNEVAFVMFTGKGREEVAVKALNLGADRYINKNGDTEAVYCELIHALTFIVERKKAQYMLLENAKKISQLNEKLRVVGSLTRHDVRNRLTALNGHVYLLKKKLAADPYAMQHLCDVEVASKQIAELLEFAHLYERLGVEKLKFVDVEEYVNDAIALFSDLNGITVTNNCQNLIVLADSLLRQIFYNLIENTIKHGGNSTHVCFYYQEEPTQFKLIYEDNGKGVLDEQKHALFEECTDGKLHHGLYVVRRICEAYNWTVQECGRYGQGAQFIVCIPKPLVKNSVKSAVSVVART